MTVATETGSPMLEVAGVRKSFGGIHALRGVDLTIRRGEVSGLIGPNGAGKSTLFNVVTGVIEPDEGTVKLAGEDIGGRGLDEMARAKVARTFQAPRGFSSMTVLDNLLVVPASKGEGLFSGLVARKSARKASLERAEQVLTRLGLTALRDVPYEELSGGELRLLEIGRHLMRDIELLMLDEPTAGVSPAMQEHIATAVRDLASSGITVLIVEHNLRFVFSLATDICAMVQGQVVCSGTPTEVQNDPAVIEAYLGGGVKA
jgi:ABC-type branched-subunit amino acid transport system ATPase component